MRQAKHTFIYSVITFMLMTAAWASSAWAQLDGGPGGISDQPQTTPKNYFTVMWREDAPPTRVVRVDQLEDLVAPPDFVLVDLEISGLGSDRQFAGVYRKHTGASELFTEMSLAALTIKNQEMEADGFCLRGIETTGKDDNVRFAGVWRPECSGAVLESDLTPVDFADRLRELGESFHLVDFETSIKDGHMRITGLWHPGAEVYRVWSSVGLDWFTFHDQIHELTESGFVLDHLDVQIKPTVQAEGMDPVLNPPDWSAISGVWRQSVSTRSPKEDWLGADYNWGQVDWVDGRLALGHGVAALDHGFEPGEGSGNELAIPSGTLTIGRTDVYIAAIEMTPSRVFLDSCRMHSGPLHDSGTAGAP